MAAAKRSKFQELRFRLRWLGALFMAFAALMGDLGHRCAWATKDTSTAERLRHAETAHVAEALPSPNLARLARRRSLYAFANSAPNSRICAE
jgi:hypothetical protein